MSAVPEANTVVAKRSPLALIVALRQYGNSADLMPLPVQTMKEARDFTRWLVASRGVDARDIWFCGSPMPKVSEVPVGVNRCNGTYNAIYDAVKTIGESVTGHDTGRDLFIYVSGHGFSLGDDAILPSYDHHRDHSNFCFSINNLQGYFAGTIGKPGSVFWFVNSCRTPRERGAVPQLNYEKVAQSGRAVGCRLYAAADGSGARTSSEFASALLRSLKGDGPAKRWVVAKESYWVTFDGVRACVEAAMPQTTSAEGPLTADALIMQLKDVGMELVTVVIRDAQPGQRFRFSLVGVQGRDFTSIYLNQPEQVIAVPPDRWIPKLELVGQSSDSPLTLVHPAPDATMPGVAMFGPTRLEFSGTPVGDSLFTIDSSPGALTYKLSQGNRRRRHRGAGASTRWTANLPIRIEVYEGDEEVSRRWLVGNDSGSPTVTTALDAPSNSSVTDWQRVTEPRVVLADSPPPFETLEIPTISATSLLGRDPDAAVFLAALASLRIGGDKDVPLHGELLRFADLKSDESAVYVLAPPTGGEVWAESPLKPSSLAPIPNLTPPTSHASFFVAPGRVRIGVRLPGCELIVQSASFPGRVTLLIILPDVSPQGRPDRWSVRQFVVRPRHLRAANLDPERSRYAALIQRRMSQGRPATATGADDRHANLWTTLTNGLFADPLQTLLAAYELIRQGGLKTDEREVIQRLRFRLRREHALKSDLAILDASLTGANVSPDDIPMVLDGAMHAARLLTPEGFSFVYGSVWTSWRPPATPPSSEILDLPVDVALAPGGSSSGYLYRPDQLLVPASFTSTVDAALRSVNIRTTWMSAGSGYRLARLAGLASVPAIVAWLNNHPETSAIAVQPNHVFYRAVVAHASSGASVESASRFARGSPSSASAAQSHYFIDEIELAHALANPRDDTTAGGYHGYTHADRGPALPEALGFPLRRFAIGRNDRPIYFDP